ncbi:transcriptional regulator, LacI family [Bosea sp. OK403]|uniref:LacI family DNA-binding transcriptional regulator n=1 Tax=Bosea sp. OK403 TaxID=1855286 RepID=UPI0008EFCD08|nr:substrate-binding domain-containing protein [Bosea sp. OK403]SFJ73933.1 transcriptional regulator, LacI family [Bosea sp. OK403]
MPPTSRPTLEDVARLAGVSLGSASRALSIPAQVKPGTLERVRRAVEQLGYIRSGAAQALASRRTRTVAAIYPTLDNPIFAVSIHALQRTLWELGYQLLIASHDYKPEREGDVLRAIVERGVDAIVLVGSEHSDEVFELARKYELPYVLTWSFNESKRAQSIGFSYYEAAYEMASLVASYGHTRIALCSGIANGNDRVRARIAGTRAALKVAGLELRSEWIVEQPFNFEGGRQAVRHILSGKDRPTVLICGTDLNAVGAIDECRSQGIRVPEDLSITGTDDIELAGLVEPKLTTIHVPTVEIGVRAARKVVAMIEGAELADELPMETRLVVRASLGRL